MDQKRYVLCAATAVLAVLTFATSSKAGGAAGAPPVPASGLTEIDLSASALYDSNVARSGTALAVQRGLKLADEVSSPNLNIVLSRPLGPATIFLDGAGGYDFHARNKILDRGYFNVNGGVGATTGECQGSVTGGYSQAMSDVADLVLGPVSNTQSVETAGGSLTCGRAIGLTSGLVASEQWTGNSGFLYRQLNSQTFNVTGNIGYRRPILGTISIVGTYSDAYFPDRPVGPPLGLIRNYEYQLIIGGLRYERNIGVRITVSGSLSYTSLSPNVSVSPNFSGLTYSLDASYQLSSRLTFHASAERATAPSSRPDSNYSINDTYLIDASYRLGSRLTLKVAGDLKQEDYRSSLPITVIVNPAGGVLPQVTNERTYGVLATATYAATRRLSFVLSAGNAERQANVRDLNYSSTTVRFTAKAAF